MIKKLIFLSVLLITVFTSCTNHHPSRILNRNLVTLIPDSNSERRNSGAVTDFNSNDYFSYKGEPMVFNNELLKSFPDEKYHGNTFGNWRKISSYDNMIRYFSASINWDWRLLASLICQESNFDPTVRSNAGAFGLMQIMPDTGNNFGIDITSSPENNIKAGIDYINWLHSIFDRRIPDRKERIKFILAAYNAGPGHVLDAMKLAGKNGMDPQKWKGNVEVWMIKKSEPQYYNDTVVRSGYFRGTESVHFVSQVLERFEHYKNIIPEENSHPF